MKQFFARMSFPRAVIVFCTLGSLALGALVFLKERRLSQIETELQRVQEVLKQTQINAYRYDELERQSRDEKFKGQSAADTFIRNTAQQDKINMGQVDITNKTTNFAPGVDDKIYTVKPGSKRNHSLLQIGNFLYTLEKDSSRVKITRLKLTPAEKLSPGEIGKDQWIFEADLTTRIQTGAAPTQDQNRG